MNAGDAAPAAMDIPDGGPHLPAMFARLATLLTALALAVLTMTASAHAAARSAEADHSVHAGQVMQIAPEDGCRHGNAQHCASVDAGTCEVYCGGSAAFSSMSSEDPGRDRSPAIHDRPSAAIIASRTPGPHEHPPEPHRL